MATETKTKQETMPAAELAQAVAQLMALATSDLPATRWCDGDDLCDCTFQRIAEWTNPYLGRTLRVRLCCIWAQLYKQYPQFVQEVPAWWDANRHCWQTKPKAWDSPKADMPVGLWFRALAIKEGKTLPQIRKEYAGREHQRPQRKAAPSFSIAPEVAPAELERSLRKRLVDAKWMVKEDGPLPDLG